METIVSSNFVESSSLTHGSRRCCIVPCIPLYICVFRSFLFLSILCCYYVLCCVRFNPKRTHLEIKEFPCLVCDTIAGLMRRNPRQNRQNLPKQGDPDSRSKHRSNCNKY